MNKGSLTKLGKLGLLAAGGVLVADFVKSQAAETNPKTGEALGFVGETSDDALISKIVQAFRNDKELLKQIKGLQGSTGPQGPQGIQGPTGLAGDMYRNFHDSLIRNGAVELGTTENWAVNASTISIGETYEGMPSFLVNFVPAGPNVANSTVFRIDNKRLIRVTLNVKSTASFLIWLNRKTEAGTNLLHSGSTIVTSMNTGAATYAAWTQKNMYFGGTGTGGGDFGEAAKLTLVLSMNGGTGTVNINKLRVVQVPLSEPVPYNLYWLPVGQVVYDPTTYDIGMYTGSAINWAS